MNAMLRSRIEQLIDGGSVDHAIKRWLGPIMRRCLDLLVASFGLLLLLPFIFFVALAIKLDSPGPVFYWGTRVGKGGKRFRMLKFRTMYDDPSSHEGPRITGNGDGRITVIGHWLRDTKLNEIPQLWNVLVGEMSLVGPRPEDPAYVELWPEEKCQLILSVRPGMTSPASIVYRDEGQMLPADNVEEEYVRKILPDKLRLDTLYIHGRSLLGDLDIILWTAVVLIPLLRKRRIPDEHLLWGPVARFMSRYFSWFVVDALVVFAVVTTTGILWRSRGPLDVGVGVAFLLALLTTLVFSLANYILGLGRIHWSNATPGYILALFGSAMIATIVLLLVNQQFPTPLPTSMLIVVGLLAWLGFVVVRYRLRLVTGAAQHWLNIRPGTSLVGERVLIVGAGVVGRFAATLLSNKELLPTYFVVGGVDDNLRRRDAQIGGFRVLGGTSDIAHLVRKYEIDLIVFAITNLKKAEQKRILGCCDQTSARVIFLPDIVDVIQARFIGPGENGQPSNSHRGLQHAFIELDYLLREHRVAEARQYIKSFLGQQTETEATQIAAD